jgi:hypothetical protein
VQHVLWNRSKVLVAQENEVVIGSADGARVACFGRSYFLLPNGVYDLFASRVTLLLGDFERFDVRGSELI